MCWQQYLLALSKCWQSRAGQCTSVALSALILATNLSITSKAAAEAASIPTEQTAVLQQSKAQPLSQGKQSAATDASSELPPLPTEFPLLPDVAVQAPKQVTTSAGAVMP